MEMNKAEMKQAINPLTRLDYPDPDVIRVEDTYYMVSTTMYFMPGCEILRSYDLVNWEHAAYVYDVLDSTEGQRLEAEKNIYGKGMWAACLRYHKGMFYVCFVANDTHTTYLYKAPSIEGPWEKSIIEGFYHDCSLLFDEDDRVYIAYGNKEIHLLELEPDLSGPKKGGLNRIVVSDEGHPGLGYEGTHLYKINGKYYLFFIHSLRDQWKRVEACFVADSLDGEFVGGDVLNDDMGYLNQGVAQGGIVDTPKGSWYAVLFQDRGAVGRIPVLLPIHWENDYPVFGVDGRVPQEFPVTSTYPEYVHEPLVQSDDFKSDADLDAEPKATGRVVKNPAYDSFGFKSCWQFNHEPDLHLVEKDTKKGTLKIQTDKLCENLLQARNVLTQRMTFPVCEAEVTIDVSELQEGDYAGLCALQGCYGMVVVTRRNGSLWVEMHECCNDRETNVTRDCLREQVALNTTSLRLRVRADFQDMRDVVDFSYDVGEGFQQIGPVHKLYFGLDHFTGCRVGLFVYSTQVSGGSVKFSKFMYNEQGMNEK